MLLFLLLIQRFFIIFFILYILTFENLNNIFFKANYKLVDKQDLVQDLVIMQRVNQLYMFD